MKDYGDSKGSSGADKADSLKVAEQVASAVTSKQGSVPCQAPPPAYDGHGSAK